MLNNRLVRPSRLGAAPAGRASSNAVASLAAPRAVLLQRARPVSVHASKPGDDKDKSWGEIASEAADVAKSVFDKVKTGASAALEAITKPSAPPAPRGGASGGSPWQQPRDSSAPLAPPFGDGLLGRALGGLVAGAVRSIGDQMAAAQRETAAVCEDAAAAIRASPEVAARLGGPVTVGGPVSQSTSSASVNGRVTKRVALVLPVIGAGGRTASARVISTEGPAGVATTDITVLLPGGEAIAVDAGAWRGGGRAPPGGAAGRGPNGRYPQAADVIDAEFTEIK